MRRSSAPSFRKENIPNIQPNDEDIPSTASIMNLIRLKRKTGTSSENACNSQPSDVSYFSVVYAQSSAKKHTIWTGDGFVEIRDNCGTLKDAAGKSIGSTRLKSTELSVSDRLFIGSYQVELIDKLKNEPIYHLNTENRVSENVKSEAKTTMSQLPGTSTDLRLNETEKHFRAMFAKQSSRKHKIWSGDGFVQIVGNLAVLKDMYGVHKASTKLKTTDNVLNAEIPLIIGQYDVELSDELKSLPVYTNPSLNLITNDAAEENTSNNDETEQTPRKKLKSQATFKPILYLNNLNKYK